MSLIRPRPQQKLLGRLRSQEGIAFPVALVMLLVISVLATVAATAATSGASQSSEDRGVKRAIAAVDAGLQAALYRANKIPQASNKCVTAGANGTLAVSDPSPDGWCAAQSESLDDGASFTYRVSQGRNVLENGQSLVQRKIVSSGCVLAGATPAQCLAGAGVKRRAMTTVAAVDSSLFGAGGVLSKESLTVQNNGYVASSVASNDDIVIRNNGEICGDAVYGPSAGDDFAMQNNAIYDCPGTGATRAQQDFLLNPVNGNAARAGNDNARITSGQDGVVGTISWDAPNKILKLNNSAILTLTGDTYSFCYLELDNGAQLRIAPRSGRPPLRIFIDTPENCAAAGTNRGSVKVQNNATIVNETNDPAMLQLYVEGSTAQSTSVAFRNNSGAGQDMDLVVYAPNSNLVVENNGNLRGAVAAKSILIDNNGKVTWDDRASVVTMSTAAIYQRQAWQECAVQAAGPAPDAGC
jgi:Tfp pilus assembly protein PilX